MKLEKYTLFRAYISSHLSWWDQLSCGWDPLKCKWEKVYTRNKVYFIGKLEVNSKKKKSFQSMEQGFDKSFTWALHTCS